MLKRGETYRRADPLNNAERCRFHIPVGTGAIAQKQICIKAVWDGSPRRPPKAGEWYFSGDPVAAWRAGADLTTPYHIARLVKTETRTVVVIVEDDA